MTEGSKTESPRQAVAFAEFLESSPPDVEETIGDLVVQHPGRPGLFRINRPHIQLHCPSTRAAESESSSLPLMQHGSRKNGVLSTSLMFVEIVGGR